MNEAESKLRGGKAPSRVASTRPSPAQPAAAARPSIFESFFGGRKSAAVNTAAGAAGASGASAWAGRAPNPAENADLARRKAEAEARRAREQQKQQRASHTLLCQLTRHAPRAVSGMNSIESHASDGGFGGRRGAAKGGGGASSSQRAGPGGLGGARAAHGPLRGQPARCYPVRRCALASRSRIDAACYGGAGGRQREARVPQAEHAVAPRQVPKPVCTVRCARTAATDRTRAWVLVDVGEGERPVVPLLKRAVCHCHTQIRERAGSSRLRAHPHTCEGHLAGAQPSVGRQGVLVLWPCKIPAPVRAQPLKWQDGPCLDRCHPR
jgi:hypothetical protein